MADPIEIVTVRIPELPSHPGPLSLADKIPIWHAAINKTVQTPLSDVRDLVLTGGSGGALPVVQNGDTIIYIVPPSEAGGTIASIPSLAGKTFKNRRRGNPLIPQTAPTPQPSDEYACLSAGGFELLQDGDILFEGERFELEVFQLQGGSVTPGTGSGSSLISGQVIITTNLTLNAADHLNKLISIRAGSSKITVTLPSVDDVPDNSIIVFETTILNNWQARITTQGGQYIYMRNNNYSSLYMGKSESLWLYRADDGWYVINDFANNYAQIGKIQASYSIEMNEVFGNGAVVFRADHPRLWEKVQTFGASLVSEATWLTPSAEVAGRTVSYPYRGCYSTGDGSTTFRLPDLQYMALRGLPGSGTDSQRHHNNPGGYQRHEYESHSHDLTVPPGKTSQGADGQGRFTSGNSNFEFVSINTVTTDSVGGGETRMENTGVYWTIKE